jgi:hypothetical protein
VAGADGADGQELYGADIKVGDERTLSKSQVVGLVVGDAGEYRLSFEYACTNGKPPAIAGLVLTKGGTDRDFKGEAKSLQFSCSISDPTRASWSLLDGENIKVAEADAHAGVLWVRLLPGSKDGKLLRVALVPAASGRWLVGKSAEVEPLLATGWMTSCKMLARRRLECVSAGCTFNSLENTCAEAVASNYDKVVNANIVPPKKVVGPPAPPQVGDGGEKTPTASPEGCATYRTPWSCASATGCKLAFETNTCTKRTQAETECDCGNAPPTDYSGAQIVRDKKSFCLATGCSYGPVLIDFGGSEGKQDRCYNVSSAEADRDGDNCGSLKVPALEWNRNTIVAGCYSDKEPSDAGPSVASTCFAASSLQGSRSVLGFCDRRLCSKNMIGSHA